MTAGTDTLAEIIDRDATSITVRVPMTFTRRGDRKIIIAPDGAPVRPGTQSLRQCVDNTMVMALARAFRWQRLLDSSDYGSLDELARAEKINRSYVSRVLRPTLLAPEIIEAILDGRQTKHITMAKLTKPFPVEWEKQREMLH